MLSPRSAPGERCGPAALADRLHLIRAALEIAGETVGGLPRQFVGVGIGGDIDISDVTDIARRQPRHREHRPRDGSAVLVLFAVVGDLPALDDRKRLAACGAPFDLFAGRAERAEPGLRRRFLRLSRAISAHRDHFAQIALVDQHHKAGFAVEV